MVIKFKFYTINLACFRILQTKTPVQRVVTKPAISACLLPVCEKLV